MKLNHLEELGFHHVQFRVIEHWKEFAQGTVAHWLVFPHLVRNQQ
jgi:hypothetical protein